MNPTFIVSLLTFVALTFSMETNAANCPEGQFFRKGHFRNGYVRSDGVSVSPTTVSSACVTKFSGYDFWEKRLKNGLPKGWPNREQPGKWSDDQHERVLEALGDLPELLYQGTILGIHRAGKSIIFPNPASRGISSIVLYDTAFERNRNLARVLGHELAHVLYENLPQAQGRDYVRASKWGVKIEKDDIFWSPRKGGYVEEDGANSLSEDFANNVEYFLFDPEVLRKRTPTVFDWLQKTYGDKLKLRGKR